MLQFLEISRSQKKGIRQTEGRREKEKAEDNKSRSGSHNIGERNPKKRNPALQQPGEDLLGQLKASNSALDNTDILQGRKKGIEPSEGQRPGKEQAEDIRNRSSSSQQTQEEEDMNDQCSEARPPVDTENRIQKDSLDQELSR